MVSFQHKVPQPFEKMKSEQRGQPEIEIVHNIPDRKNLGTK